MTWTLHEGDCLEVMRGMPDNCVDSVVTDPPYELGFMGKKWDASGIAYSVDLWREALRVLKPGGHLLSFGGTRTYHRMTCAIEDAGFEIRDQLQWLYGQGFPKSLNLGQGRGTALKPANEPICLARKPASEPSVTANVARWGTGGLNIEGSRVGTDTIVQRQKDMSVYHGNKLAAGASTHMSGITTQTIGRFPANLLLDETAATILDEQSGASRFFYVAKASKLDRGIGNSHPTVKPVKVMEWLVNLVTPPGGKVLDPFAGSGTTLLAATRKGLSVVGIEKESEYCAIIRKRMADEWGLIA